MITKVLKNDGRRVNFNVDRITKSIYRAASSIGGQNYEKAEELAQKVYIKLDKQVVDKQVNARDIQKAIEEVLETEGHKSTLRAYLKYRLERNRALEVNSELMRTYDKLTFQDSKDSDTKRENANINADTAMGIMLKYGSEGAKKFYDLAVLKREHSEAHKNGDIHIHDLDFLALTTTCCQIDLVKLFKDGFCTGEGHLREPQSIGSYAALAAIAIQSNQNDQHGGQSIPNFEYAMAKGVRVSYKKGYLKNLEKAIELLTDVENSKEFAENIVKSIKYDKDIVATYKDSNNYLEEERKYLECYFDQEIIEKIQGFTVKYTEKEIEKLTYQAMEGFIHNLNTMHSRAGAQVPFSSINYGLDMSQEGRLVMEQVLKTTEAGLGNGETPIFPIQILKVKDGINYNKEDPNYDIFKLACKVSAKRLFPNFSFIDAPFNLKYYHKGDYDTEVAYMGCRTRVIGNVYDSERETTCGRGNLSFTSINLPRLGIEAHGDLEIFFELLDEKVELVLSQLQERFKIQANKSVYNYPFLMGQNVWIDSDKLSNTDKVGEILKHGSLTLGFIGLAECLKALIGKHHGEDEQARELGLKIIARIREKADEESEKMKMNFTVIATPAEGLSGRFVKVDRKKYGNIKGVTDKEYYTNSFHVPVYHNINAFNKIKIEAPYHELTNGGHISYVELDGDPSDNLDAFEQIIRCMKESGIGYGSINHPVDRDPFCGYTGVIKDKCPNCGRNEFEKSDVGFERIRRITGYLVGTLDRFNNGKRAEERDRVKHDALS